MNIAENVLSIQTTVPHHIKVMAISLDSSCNHQKVEKDPLNNQRLRNLAFTKGILIDIKNTTQ